MKDGFFVTGRAFPAWQVVPGGQGQWGAECWFKSAACSAFSTAVQYRRE